MKHILLLLISLSLAASAGVRPVGTGGGSGSGTVTSVSMTVPSFLSVSGSPLITSGTLAVTLSGTALPIANGGTGQTTANNAFNALAPSQGSNSGKFLTTNGSTTSWATVSGADPSLLGNGSTSAPSYSFTSETNTGIYRVGSNDVGVTIGGVLSYHLKPAEYTPGIDGGANLGNASLRWSTLFADTIKAGGALSINPSAAGLIDFGGNRIQDLTEILFFTTGATKKIDTNGNADGSGTDSIQISSGNASAGGNVGSLLFITGNASSGSPGAFSFAPGTGSTAAGARFLYTAAADTALTTTIEAPSVLYDMSATRTHATGDITLQRDFRIAPTTHAFAGASLVAGASTVSIDGPPIAGTNATITSARALRINGGTLTNTTNSFALMAIASSGATNNYAASFTGGSVGIGNSAPTATLDITGNQNITSASANSLTIGPNGATNPVLQVDGSIASAVAGLAVQGQVSGSGVTLSTISSATNDGITVNSKGTGSVILNTPSTTGIVSLRTSSNARFAVSGSTYNFTPATLSTAATARMSYVGSADTNMTLSTEAPNWYINLGQTRQHAQGTLALQRDVRITPSTHSFATGASALTEAAAFSVDSPPSGGTNATIARSSAIYVPSTSIANTTVSVGAFINAASGATTNYSAIFLGGNMGIGTSTPAQMLDVSGKFQVMTTGLTIQDATITAGGTTGNQTINKPTGTVNFAAAASAITVTNSLVSTSSLVFAVARTNDATCTVKNVVPGSGSFVITMSANCTAETSVGFKVVNQ